MFIAFTQAMVNMPVPQLWAILFFTMLLTLGLSSMFGYIEALLTPLLDLKIFPHSWPKEVIQGVT